MLYNFKKIKYELRKISFKVFNNTLGKHRYYTTKKVLYVGLNIYKNDFKWNCKVIRTLRGTSSSYYKF